MKNSLVLAYLGDAIYELFIREYLIGKNINNVKELQKESINYVSAKSQRIHLERLINAKFLTNEEIELVKRGRNAKGGKSKSSDIITYRLATGLEYLVGYLYLNDNNKRIDEIMNFIVESEKWLYLVKMFLMN